MPKETSPDPPRLGRMDRPAAEQLIGDGWVKAGPSRRSAPPHPDRGAKAWLPANPINANTGSGPPTAATAGAGPAGRPARRGRSGRVLVRTIEDIHDEAGGADPAGPCPRPGDGRRRPGGRARSSRRSAISPRRSPRGALLHPAPRPGPRTCSGMAPLPACPAAYNAALDGPRIGPTSGSCGTAAIRAAA